MLAGLGDILARVGPEASAVVIVQIIFKMITLRHDKDWWRRLMFVVVPLLIVVLELVGVAVWWLLADGGVHVILGGFGRPYDTRPIQRESGWALRLRPSADVSRICRGRYPVSCR